MHFHNIYLLLFKYTYIVVKISLDLLHLLQFMVYVDWERKPQGIKITIVTLFKCKFNKG